MYVYRRPPDYKRTPRMKRRFVYTVTSAAVATRRYGLPVMGVG